MCINSCMCDWFVFWCRINSSIYLFFESLKMGVLFYFHYLSVVLEVMIRILKLLFLTKISSYVNNNFLDNILLDSLRTNWNISIDFINKYGINVRMKWKNTKSDNRLKGGNNLLLMWQWWRIAKYVKFFNYSWNREIESIYNQGTKVIIAVMPLSSYRETAHLNCVFAEYPKTEHNCHSIRIWCSLDWLFFEENTRCKPALCESSIACRKS